MNTDFILTAVLGSAVGAVMGLTGAGGGILSVPALVMLLHIPLQSASPVALCAISLSAAVAAAVGLARGQLRYRAAGLMAAAGLLTSPIGLFLSGHLPAAPLQLAFGLLMTLTAAAGFRNTLPSGTPANPSSTESPLPPCRLDPTIGRLVWTNPCARALAGSGALAGFMAGLLGVGGGFVLIPALRRYTDLGQQAIVATSLGVLALVTGGSALLAAAQGRVDSALAVPFVAGSVLGLGLGKWIEPRLSGNALTRAFHLLAFGTGILLIVRTLT